MSSVNYLPLFSSVIAAMAIGFLWYGPLFGRPWMRLTGMTPERIDEAKKDGMSKLYAGQFIMTLVMLYVLDHFLIALGVVDLFDGIVVAIWIWVGFVLTTHANYVFWERRPVALFLLSAGNMFVTLVVSAAILTLWR